MTSPINPPIRGVSSVATKNTGFRFRWALPLGQLVICAVLLWPARQLLFLELGVPRQWATPPMVFSIDWSLLQTFARWSVEGSMNTVAMINVPVVLFQLPWQLTAGEQIVRTLSFRAWRAVTFPVLGMVFWWIAGRGADALRSAKSSRLAPKTTWMEAIWGFLLLVAGSTTIIGVECFSGKDRAALQSMATIAALWAFLGSLSVAGRIVQWRLRKRLVDME
jgi:hypothetical protein